MLDGQGYRSCSIFLGCKSVHNVPVNYSDGKFPLALDVSGQLGSCRISGSLVWAGEFGRGSGVRH